MGMEHGCKSNETMKAAVYCDPRILIIRLTCRREREFNFSSNQLSVVNYYSHLPVFFGKDGLLIYPHSDLHDLSPGAPVFPGFCYFHPFRAEWSTADRWRYNRHR